MNTAFEPFEQAFAKLNARVANAFNLGDVKTCGEFYTEDATMFLTDHDPIKGRSAIEAALREYSESGAMLMPVEPLVIKSSDDMAVCAGNYEFTVTGDDGTPQKEQGKFVTFFARQPDGSWKAIIDSIMRDGESHRCA